MLDKLPHRAARRALREGAASVAILAGALLAWACTGAGSADRVARHPDSTAAVARDDFGVPFAIGRTPPARIVSLDPTTTEILFAIGAGSRLVGRSHWDTRPDSARRVPDLGPGLRPSVEAVLGVRPDLVLLYASADDRAAADRLRTAGIATVALRIDRIDQFRSATRLLGRLVGQPGRAAAVVDSVGRTLARVRAATASLAQPSVFVHTWERPLITVGRRSFLSEVVSIAGGRNLFDDVPGPSVTTTLEEVLRRDPDVILVSPTTAAEVRGSPTWRSVRAVRSGHLAVYDTAVVGRASVTLGMAAVELARRLHPEHAW